MTFVLLSLQDFAVFSFTQLLGETLHELDLTSCANLTDLSVCSIAAHLRNLVVLRLARCKQITDWGLLGVVEATKNNAEQEMVRSRSRCGGGIRNGQIFVISFVLMLNRGTRVRGSPEPLASWASSSLLACRLRSDPRWSRRANWTNSSIILERLS